MKKIFLIIMTLLVLSTTIASTQVNANEAPFDVWELKDGIAGLNNDISGYSKIVLKENVTLKIIDVLKDGNTIKIKIKLEDKKNMQEYQKEYLGVNTAANLATFFILKNGEWKYLSSDDGSHSSSLSFVYLTGYYNKELTFYLPEYYGAQKLSHPVNGHFKMQYCGYEAEFDINNNILSNASDKNNLDNDLNNASGEVLNNIGMKYLLGDGVEKDYNLSKQYFEMAAAKGYTNSLNNLALMILEGKISGTKEQARQYLETAGANGLAESYYNLGRLMTLEVIEGKVGEALMYLEKAVEMGDEKAKTFLEDTFISDIINPNLNSMSAEELLAYPYQYYWEGLTTVAIKCWEAAASKGSVEALRKLGDLYSNYDTVTLEQLIDIEEAKHYYIEAATLGDEHSKNRLEQLGVRYY